MNMMVSAAAMTAAASIPAAAEGDPAFAAIKGLQAAKEGFEAAVAEEIRRTKAADEQIPLRLGVIDLRDDTKECLQVMAKCRGDIDL